MTDDRDQNEFIQGPRWRVRTTPAKRHQLAVVTVALIVLVGLAIMGPLIRLLASADAPGVVVLLPWLVPTVAMLVWVVSGAEPAIATADDDEQSWPGYAIRFVLVGEDEPRPVPARVAAAVVLGGPIGWPVLLVGCATLLGLF
jgi:hypothetical protein